MQNRLKNQWKGCKTTINLFQAFTEYLLSKQTVVDLSVVSNETNKTDVTNRVQGTAGVTEVQIRQRVGTGQELEEKL